MQNFSSSFLKPSRVLLHESCTTSLSFMLWYISYSFGIHESCPNYSLSFEQNTILRSPIYTSNTFLPGNLPSAQHASSERNDSVVIVTPPRFRLKGHARVHQHEINLGGVSITMLSFLCELACCGAAS